jgi:lipid-A-disaccharide synthase
MTHITIIAGEPSGDFLGAKLIAALKTQAEIKLSGVGGPQMKSEGLESLFPYEDLAVMGVAEVLPKLPLLISRIRQTVKHVVESKPDVVVTIDSPDFSFRVAKAVKKQMDAAAPKIIHYVAPTVWAWREGRAAKISKFLDGLICLFDFEPLYFEPYNLKAVAVGHPLVEGTAMHASGARFREEWGIGGREPIIGVLFGSRKGELKKTGRILREAAFSVAQRIGSNVHIVAPTLPHVKKEVFDLLKDAPCAIHITDDAAEKFDAFRAMDVALAVSGTVGLELAALQVPHVIAYKANAVTAAIVRRLVKVRHAHLANIMAGEEIVPEFLQENAKPEAIADKAFDLFLAPGAQKDAMAGIAARLGFGEEKTPSEKAADFILSF